MKFSYLYIRSPNGKTPWKKSPPGGETPYLWRTEKPQNCTPKMPNVTSETHRKCCFAAFGSFFFLLLLWILATCSSCCCRGFCCCCWSLDGKNTMATTEAFAAAAAGPRMEKHHGKNHFPAGKHHTSAEKPQNCTPKMPNVTSETHRKWCFWLLFPLAAAMNFTFTSGPQMGKHHGKNHLPGAKHHASEGRRSPKIAPRKCLT